MTDGGQASTLDDLAADRLTGLAAAANDLGQSAAELTAAYAPGSFGCHEALHTAALLMDVVDQRLCEHPAILANAEWYRLARAAHAKLFDLYQAIGAAHLGSGGGEFIAENGGGAGVRLKKGETSRGATPIGSNMDSDS